MAAYFEYAQDFVANSSVVPDLPVITLNATETGDGYVPRRSALRGWQDWNQPMAQAGTRCIRQTRA